MWLTSGPLATLGVRHGGVEFWGKMATAESANSVMTTARFLSIEEKFITPLHHLWGLLFFSFHR